MIVQRKVTIALLQGANRDGVGSYASASTESAEEIDVASLDAFALESVLLLPEAVVASMLFLVETAVVVLESSDSLEAESSMVAEGVFNKSPELAEASSPARSSSKISKRTKQRSSKPLPSRSTSFLARAPPAADALLASMRASRSLLAPAGTSMSTLISVCHSGLNPFPLTVGVLKRGLGSSERLSDLDMVSLVGPVVESDVPPCVLSKAGLLPTCEADFDSAPVEAIASPPKLWKAHLCEPAGGRRH